MRQAEKPVWDIGVRVGHWLLVLAFTIAYSTEGEPEIVHTAAGYTIAAIVAVRVVWGFIGPKHARFADFVYRPSAVLAYLRDLLRLGGRRYIGHSPAGGAMVVALLLSLAATTFTGMGHLAEEENAGPLAPWFGRAGPVMEPAETEEAEEEETGTEDEDGEDREEEESLLSPILSSALAHGREDHRDKGRKPKGAFEDIHEFFANLTLLLVLIHIGGVALAGYVHRENLVRAMINGRKRIDTD